MQPAVTEQSTNAKRAAARNIGQPPTLQEREAEKRLLIQQQLESDRAALIEAERRYLDADGNVLHYFINFAKTKEKPSPIYGSVNDHKYAIPRGVDSKVPWYVVVHHANNKESTYRPVASGDGKHIVPTEEQQLAEHFQARAINPIPGAELPY